MLDLITEEEGDRDMSYGDIVVALIYAMQMMICVLFALPYKRSKKHIFLLAVVTIVEYYILKLTTLHIEIYWLAYVVEFFGTLLVLALFNSGNIWRNFFISWFNFQCANLLIVLEAAVASYFINIDSVIIFGASGENDEFVFLEIILMVVNSLAALAISRKLFKLKYNNDGRIYKYLVAVIVFLGTILGLKRSTMIVEARDGSSTSIYKIYITSAIIIIVLMYLVGYIYNFAENRRLLKEREALKQIITNNYAQYARAMDNNRSLQDIKNNIQKKVNNLEDGTTDVIDTYGIDTSTYSLSGNLTIDTLVSGYYKEAKSSGITLELCILPIKSDIDRDMKFAAIIDELMQLAIEACNKCTGSRWIYFRISQDLNSIIIKLEYSRPEEYKLKTKHLRLTHQLILMDKGAMNIDNKDREVGVSIMLP